MRGSPREAGGTEPVRGSPREAEGTESRRGSPREAGGTEPVRGSPREAGGEPAGAGTVFPSVGVNGQARRGALTPCVPLSREAGEGDYGVRKRSFRLMLKLTLQHSKQVSVRLTPLPQRVGEGLGVRANTRCRS